MKKVDLILIHSDGSRTIEHCDPSATLLRLYRKEIVQVQGLEQLSSLKHLDLSYNSITKIQGLDALVNLTSLYLHNNSISKIEGLNSLTNLVYLFLMSNSITKIEGLDNLEQLSCFHIYSNPISKCNVISEKWSYLDGFYDRIKSKKIKNGYDVIETIKGGWIVGKDDTYAHGDTFKNAKNDLVFKILQKNFDVKEIVAKIKKCNKVTVNDYRLLTGACQKGVERFKQEIGLRENVMNLADVKEKVRGRYGYERFMGLVEAN